MMFPIAFLPHTGEGKPQHSIIAARGTPSIGKGRYDLHRGTESSPGEIRGPGAIS
jgi:hypothetical protein